MLPSIGQRPQQNGDRSDTLLHKVINYYKQSRMNNIQECTQWSLYNDYNIKNTAYIDPCFNLTLHCSLCSVRERAWCGRTLCCPIVSMAKLAAIANCLLLQSKLCIMNINPQITELGKNICTYIFMHAHACPQHTKLTTLSIIRCYYCPCNPATTTSAR